MTSTPRGIAALSGLVLALSGLVVSTAQADTFDLTDYPAARRATFNQAFLTGSINATDIAVDPQPAAADDPSKFAIAEYNSKHVEVRVNSPFNSTGYALAPGTISDTTKSGLAGPQGLAYDPKGRIWVADTNAGSVSVFSKDVSNSVPYTTISGSNTGLASPYDVAIGADGDVYVANITGGPGSVRVFDAGRGGNIEPDRTINIGINQPQSIAIDSKGLIYVANLNTGSGTESITVYPANADSATAPIRTIAGDHTFLHGVAGIAVDSSDNLYVANPYDSTDGSVTVYNAGANGNVYPRARILGGAGTNTGLHQPSGVAVDTNRNIHVVNQFTTDAATVNSVFTFNPVIPLTKPGPATSLKVSGSSTSSTRTISWKAPANTGGTKITKYLVVVKKGSKTLYNKTSTALSYKLLRSKLVNGTNTVSITAVNKIGNATAATKTFTVKK